MKEYKISAMRQFCKARGIPFQTSSQESTQYVLLTINKKPIFARLANTTASVRQGLMGVEQLDTNEGCLLDFQKPTDVRLWMSNCKMNLQAAMITEAGVIVDIMHMEYNDPYRVHPSSKPVRYALEMSEYFFTQNEIKVGDIVRIS